MKISQSKLTGSLAILFLAALAPCSRAGVLVTYNFGIAPSAFVSTPSSTALNTVASSLSYGIASGFAASSGATFGSSGANALALAKSAVSIPGTIAGAIAAGTYISLQLTPASGYSLDISSFTFYANYSNATSDARSYALQIDTGSGFTTVSTGSITVQGGATPGQFITIPVSGYSDVSTATTLQLVFYDAVNAGNSWSASTRLDDLTVNGTIIAVPEPSTAGLLGLAVFLGGTVFVRRRERHQL